MRCLSSLCSSCLPARRSAAVVSIDAQSYATGTDFTVVDAWSYARRNHQLRRGQRLPRTVHLHRPQLLCHRCRTEFHRSQQLEARRRQMRTFAMSIGSWVPRRWPVPNGQFDGRDARATHCLRCPHEFRRSPRAFPCGRDRRCGPACLQRSASAHRSMPLVRRCAGAGSELHDSDPGSRLAPCAGD